MLRLKNAIHKWPEWLSLLHPWLVINLFASTSPCKSIPGNIALFIQWSKRLRQISLFVNEEIKWNIQYLKVCHERSDHWTHKNNSSTQVIHRWAETGLTFSSKSRPLNLSRCIANRLRNKSKRHLWRIDLDSSNNLILVFVPDRFCSTNDFRMWPLE